MARYSVTSLAGMNRNKKTIKRHYDLKERALVPAVGEGFQVLDKTRERENVVTPSWTISPMQSFGI